MSEIHVSDSVDVEALRVRLRKMTDAELLRLGKQPERYAAVGVPDSGAERRDDTFLLTVCLEGLVTVNCSLATKLHGFEA